MALWLAATVMSLLVSAGQVPVSEPRMALKLDAESDHVAPLPMSASEAATRFGILQPAQVAAITSASDQLFAALHRDDAHWNGPSLMVSRSSLNILESADLAIFRKELRAEHVTTYDPYSLGHRGKLTYAVVMTKLDSGSVSKWTAVAFVLAGNSVTRIIVAPQPWIHLMSNGG